MSDNSKQIRNTGYLWACRFAFWLGILFNMPLVLIDLYKGGPLLGNVLLLLFYAYLVAGVFVLGYRLDNPPGWSHWLIPKKWIVEWRYLVYTNPELIKANRNRLVQFTCGVALLTILVLASLSGKL